MNFPGVGDYDINMHPKSIGKAPGKTIGVKI
jgi:hypothetical protein